VAIGDMPEQSCVKLIERCSALLTMSFGGSKSMNERKIATKREAADYLRCTERHIDVMRKDGRLKSFRMGHGVRFWMSDLMALLT
jgi:excisionase family DNA binding protein